MIFIFTLIVIINNLYKNDNLLVPAQTNYYKIPGLSKEAAEKLSTVRPENLGQAARVSGVTPSDAVVLHLFISKQKFHVKLWKKRFSKTKIFAIPHSLKKPIALGRQFVSYPPHYNEEWNYFLPWTIIFNFMPRQC